ncbi:MAG TPA: hypothetical protein VN677_15340 [Gemmatimonadaceae bacterium]|nr:hypothetical protein [Gemmatimonadaceae bacterium]
MTPRSEQLQIRVTSHEKSALKRLARAAGQDVSAYVLARALPENAERFAGIIAALRDDANRRFALAELHDFLAPLATTEFGTAVARADLRGLSPLVQNYVAALVEQAAHVRGVPAPAWTREVAPLDVPYFAAPLRTLRLYLLRATPVPFRRRNIFADAGVGTRV